MQYSLRSLLIAVVVAGMGAAVFYSRWMGLFHDPPPAAIGCVITVLFGSTLLGLILARRRSGVVRAAFWLVPPMLAAVALIPLTKWFAAAVLRGNEREAVRACLEIALAEETYHRTDWDQDGVLQYALTAKEMQAQLPSETLNSRIADAEWPSSKPYRGYYFKILTRQLRPIERSYLDERGRMKNGYAIAAWPARYNWTGTKLFFISNAGTIYESDYGPENSRGPKIEEFAPSVPDRCWCE